MLKNAPAYAIASAGRQVQVELCEIPFSGTPEILCRGRRSAFPTPVGCNDLLMHCRREGQDRDISGPLDGHRDLSLVFGTVSRDPSRDDFPPFRDKKLENPGILVINIEFLIGTEAANFPPQKRSLPSVRPRPVARLPRFPFLSHLNSSCLGSGDRWQ